MPFDARSDFFPREISAAFDGQFELQRELGRGGMGVVYLARDLKLDRQVAIKVLPSHLASDPEVKERFLREARTAAHLAHPNVVPVHRADEIAGLAFFVMSYVEGESLADRLAARGPLPPTDAVRVLREVAWALAYAHARGVVHRDIKPENILIDRATNRVMVGDFGIARQIEASRLTQDGLVLGTVHYMSPEQINGHQLDGRSDLYALGVVAFHVLSGRLPFEGLTVPSILVAHLSKAPPPLLSFAPAVPRALAITVDRCLAKDPADRFSDCEELADALEAGLGAPSTSLVLPVGFGRRLSEPQATALWKRAAEFQSDALDRIEARRNLLATAATPESPSDGYLIRDVAAAAEEAGISRQYVAMALAELPRDSSIASAPVVAQATDRATRFFLGTDQRSLGVSCVIDAAPASVLRALGAVLQQGPFELQLRETIGPHPLDGGVLVFDLPAPIVNFNPPPSFLNSHWIATHALLEARQVHVTLRALASASDRTEVTMTCDLRPGIRRNVRASKWIAGSVGVAGVAGGGVAVATLMGVGAAAVLLPGLIVGSGLAGASLAWYRWLYSRTVEKARREMQRALDAVVRAVQSEQVFGAFPGGSQPPAIGKGASANAAALISMM